MLQKSRKILKIIEPDSKKDDSLDQRPRFRAHPIHRPTESASFLPMKTLEFPDKTHCNMVCTFRQD